jgi:hypothetical protein
LSSTELIRDACRAAREIDPAVPLTADGGGFVQVTAYRWDSTADRRREGDADGDGWMMTVRDQNGKMPGSHHMFLSDRELADDRQGHIDATAVALIAYARATAELSGWSPPPAADA